MVHHRQLPMWISLFICACSWHVAYAACPSGWFSDANNQACFKVFSNSRAYFDAATTYCINQGGYLVRDTSIAIHTSLQTNVASEAQSSTHPTQFWIGLTDNNVNNGPWLWVGGPALSTSYQNFASGSISNTPNVKDCFFVNAGDTSMKWVKTNNCNQSFSFICQREFNAPAPVATTQRPIYCPSDWVPYPTGNTCIKLYTTPASWTDARTQCRQAMSDLVRIGTGAFSNFVNTQVNAQRSLYWIGLNDRKKEGAFVWNDDTNTTSYTNWVYGRVNNPGSNENCVYIDGNRNTRWDDADCNTQYRFICQRLPMTGPPPFNRQSTPTNTNCGFGWEDVPNSDSCFSFSTTTLSWLDARADCQRKGGDLSSVSSIQEQFYLSGRSISFAVDFFWIGANDRETESGWKWTDASPFGFLNWDVKQPDNSQNADCAVLVQKSGRWDDVPCQNRNGYICKKKGKTTMTSLVTTTTPPAHIADGMMFGCPRGWDNFRGSCYKVVQISAGIDWTTASAACVAPTMQGALAAIIDNDENKFIQSILPRGTDFAWIGLEDPQENLFTWVDGTPMQYTNWDVGEPNNANNEDCVAMKSWNGRWNDAACTNTFKTYVCKKNKSILPRAGSDEEQGCVNGSIGYGAQCYSFITAQKPFNNAQADCRARSKNLGNLATIDSGYLQSFLAAELSTQPSAAYWIGLNQNNDIYKWQSNWPVSFTYWNMNHTGNERWTCAAMLQSPIAGLWTNFQCNKNFSYICESPRPGFTTPTMPTTRPQPCPNGWVGYTNYCYRVFSPNASNTLSWGDARDFCARQADGGSLITINDNATQAWLLANIVKTSNASGMYWIGLNDRDSESGYVWVDSSPFLFSNWAPNEPNDAQNREDCVEWILPANNWNDDYCYSSKNWICQVPRGSRITTPKPLVTGVQSVLCGNGSWTMSKNYCYYVSPQDGDNSAATWFSARQLCMNMGADLASITGDDENGLITSLISKTTTYSFWIGLNDLDAETYSWTDSSPVGYVSWALNEPNDAYGGEGCVEIRSTGLWNDNQCQSKFGYVCKKRPGGFTLPPSTTQSTAGGCPRNDFVSLPALSYCYYIGGNSSDSRKNYTDAITACDQMVHKSVLASVHSSLEEKFIYILTANLRMPAWIGLNDRRVNNQFEWVDNSVVSYTHWGPGQPSENVNDKRPDARRDCVDLEVRQNGGGPWNGGSGPWNGGGGGGGRPNNGGSSNAGQNRTGFWSGRQNSAGTWNDRQCTTPLAYICQSKKGATLPTATPNTAGCKAGYQSFQSSCYRYYRDRYTWDQAQAMCVTDGANLVTLNSGIEQAYTELLTGHFNDTLQFWIGLKYDRDSSTFKWANSYPMRYSNWAHGEPDTTGSQNCVTDMVDGQWQVVNCSDRHSFVCEINLGTPPPSRSYTFGRCPFGNWFNFGGYCYHIESSSTKSWAGANAACANLGASLASIHSDDESKFLANYIGRLGQDVWIGLSKGQGSGFAWSDGTELEYLEWARGEPNDPESYLHQDCAKIKSTDAGWADTDCGDQNAYLCKTAQLSWFRTTQSGQTQGGNGNHGGNTNGNHGGNPGGNTNGMSRTTQNPKTQADTGSSSGLGGGAVAGIVIGILVAGVLVALVAFFVYRRSKGQTGSPFSTNNDKQILQEPGFDNASYSRDGGKVDFSDA